MKKSILLALILSLSNAAPFSLADDHSTGVQKARIALLKANTYYFNRGSADGSFDRCLLHIEVDLKNNSFVMTGSESEPILSNNTSYEDCELRVFKYDEVKDVWYANYTTSAFGVRGMGEPARAQIEILEDGNFTYNQDVGRSKLYENQFKDPIYKFVALGPSESHLVRGLSMNGASGKCGSPWHLSLLTGLMQTLEKQAADNARATCEGLFKSCYFKEVRNFDPQPIGGTSNTCMKMATFEGKAPKL